MASPCLWLMVSGTRHLGRSSGESIALTMSLLLVIRRKLIAPYDVKLLFHERIYIKLAPMTQVDYLPSFEFIFALIR